MNKKKTASLLIGFFALTLAPVCAQAGVSKIISAFASFPTYRIIHTAIESVSSVQQVFYAGISVDFASYTSATAEIEYYLNGKTEGPLNTGAVTIQNKKDFFIKIPDLSSDKVDINYRIKVVFNGTDTKYLPDGADEYFTASITDSTSTAVSGSSGGTVTFGSGNQEYGATNIVFQSGSFTGERTITIRELPVTPSLSASLSASKRQMIAQYLIESEPQLAEGLSKPALATFYYGADTRETKFSLMYSEDGITWKLFGGEISVDLTAKTVSANITKICYYAIFTGGILDDNDYRPAKRTVVKGTGRSFEFNNLTDGDSVKIYNVNGKKVREITSGDSSGFKWDGRNDDGQYAKSGIYVYQIKVSGKGKLINGTIVFVK